MTSQSTPSTVEECVPQSQAENSTEAYCVHWVHPEPRITLLAREHLTLGRDAACDVVLAGERVSRKHAELHREGSRMVLRDLGSTNRTFVDGQPLVGVVNLALGHVLRIGEWVGVVVAVRNTVGNMAPPAKGLVLGPSLAAALAPAFAVAASALPIIIQGESGTGKENAARAIHDWSGRRGALIAVNCGALPDQLAEGELFGYRRGAFTGADQASEGLLRAADGGTLLLDEILDLPLPIQTKLLRALEQREVTPLGETRPRKIDVRVLAAGQTSLADAVASGRMRGDLFARLNGVTIELPPLRHRRDEVPGLFRSFLERERPGAKLVLEPPLVESLCLYGWPMNVREVVLLAQRMAAVCREPNGRLRQKDLPDPVRKATAPPRTTLAFPVEPSPQGGLDADEADLHRLLDALRTTNGNVARASAQIGISRQRAYRLLQTRPDIRLEDFRNLSTSDD